MSATKQAEVRGDAESTPTAARGWSQRMRDAVDSLRLRDFDRLTTEQRSTERHRRIGLTALSMAGARSAALVTMLITVPITVRYLGPERYGLWVTIGSLFVMLRFADLGIGGGVVTALSQSHGRADHAGARALVSSAFFMLVGVSVILGLAFAVIGPHVPWAQLLNVTSATATSEVWPAVAVFVACLLVRLPLTLVERTQIGYQEGQVAALWQGVGTLLGLAGILIAVALEAGLPWLVLALAGGPAVAALVNTLVWFGRRRPQLRPQWHLRSRPAVRRLVQLGALFFVLDVTVAIVVLSDNLVVARLFDAAAVTQYSIPWRLAMIAPLLMSLLSVPLWPAFGEAISRSDGDWAERTLKRFMLVGLTVSLAAAAVLLTLGPGIISVWAGPVVDPSFALLLGLSLWGILASVGAPIGAFLSGAGVVRFQVISCLALAVSNIVLSIVFAHAFGLPGIIFGTVVSYLVCVVVPYSVAVPRLVSRLASDPDAAAAAASQ
jgi:O-antigen/teichoic acid export membrane protein